MAKPTAKRPDVDPARSDSFLRMLALERQYRMQRIHEQVSTVSANGGSMHSFSSGHSAVVPLRVRRSSSSNTAVGSSQVPVQSSTPYKDAPLPPLSISIPPPPRRPVAMATRDDIIRDAEIIQLPPQLSPRNPQRSAMPEKMDQSKAVTFADFDSDGDGNVSDQTSICYSPTWDTKKKKKAKPPKFETSTSDKNTVDLGSPKKKGKRLSKQPPTPGPNVRPITKAERNSGAPRFDLEEIESQATQQKSSKTKPPDAMKHPELHQKGHTSDSNEKPKNKSFFSRIRRLSFDENMKSPISSSETATPTPVQKTHSSGPGTGLGFFSSRKTQKEESKANDRRSQSAFDNRPPVSISTRPSRPSSESRGRTNSLLAATLEKLKGSSKPQETERERDASQEPNSTDAQEPTSKAETTSSSNVRTTRFIESDDILPIDTRPPAANFSKKPRSYSGSSQESAESRATSTSKEMVLSQAPKKSQSPYKSPYSEDHESTTDLSLIRPLKSSTSNFSLLSPGLTHLKNTRSSEFETASIQESIFNVVNINDRSSDYFDFITESYTPPSLDLGSPLGSNITPARSTPAIGPGSNNSKLDIHEKETQISGKSRDFSLVSSQSTDPTSVERRIPASTAQVQQASSERFGSSLNAGSETPTSGSVNLATPPAPNPKNHSRTGSERSSSSLYDDSAPTPSTPATPDSMRPIRGQDKLPTVRVSSSDSTAKEDVETRSVSGERMSRVALRQISQEAVRPSDRSASIEPRTSEDSCHKSPSNLDLDPPPTKFFSRTSGNGSSSSLASSPTSIKSAKAEMTAATQKQRIRDREMPPRAQSAVDLSSTSFLPPLKHQPLLAKKNKRSSTAPALSSPPSDSADDEGSSSRPTATRSSTANGQELTALSSSGAAYLEEARKSVQPAATGRGFRSPFSGKNSSTTSVKSTAGSRAEQPIAKMLVECCGCKFYHDMPSKVYECMAKPDSIVEDRKLGVSAAVTTMVRCPWCGHGMSTQCCAGYAAVIFIKEKLHGK